MAFKMKGFPKQEVDLTKDKAGPRAKKTKVKDDNVYVDKNKEIPLDPGYEDIEKIQTVQRLGLTPHSQKFSRNAKANTSKKTKNVK